MMSETYPKLDKNPDQTLASSGIEDTIQIQSKETGQETRDEDKNELMSKLCIWKESSGTVKEEEKNGQASRGDTVYKDEHGCNKAIPENNSSLPVEWSKSLMVQLAHKSPEIDLQFAVLSGNLSKDGDAQLDKGEIKISACNTRCQKITEKRTQPEKPDSSNKPEKCVEKEKSCKQYMKEVCSNNFKSVVTLVRHKNTSCKDSILNKIMCNVCKEEFTCSKDLKAHTKMHFAIKEKLSLRCEGCLKEFSLIPDLIRYSDVHSLKCNFCNKTFTQKGHLTMHKKVHVGTQTAHRCDHCDQTFMQRSHLLIHLRIHTGENPFTCPVCDRAFKQRGNLTVHMSQHDLNQPRFTCNICRKQFYQRSHYNIHVRIHNGDYPFTCQVCGKGFKQRGNLNVHLRTHRPKSEEKEPKKGKKGYLGKVSSDGVKLQRTSLADANMPSVNQYSYSNDSLDNSSMSNGNVLFKEETSDLQVPDMAVMKPEKNMEVNIADTEKNSDVKPVFIIPNEYQSPLGQNTVDKHLIDDCIVHDMGSASTSSIQSTENTQDTNLLENEFENQATITFKQASPCSNQRLGDLNLRRSHVDTPALIMENDYSILLSTHTSQQFQTSAVNSEPEESKTRLTTEISNNNTFIDSVMDISA
ncbi:hypothetical protein CHS0354_032714 [Potamilus streckersoni]|uniref:C2H2-type domain-containing protein n=1 Tax=Potamilus streckersoni TaxID=2493646 RepID=A0AAE0RRM7_9BIVA|nr:hypothetical protein CHS0354_032714 [Potamilus streckersoni]